MDTVFILKTGIRLWEQQHPTEEREYITISLLNQNFENVWKTWRIFASLLTQEWPMILTWYTTTTPQYSKTHEYLTLKDFSKNSGPKDIFKKHEKMEENSLTVWVWLVRFNNKKFEYGYN